MWVPFAIKKPIDLDPGDPLRAGRKALVLHTAVTTASSLYPSWKTGPIEAHFYVRKDGTLEQYLDTKWTADHAVDANPWALGLESQDNGSPTPGPWTEAQLNTIVKLAVYLDIPAQMLKCAPSDGIGYHRQCDAWNPNKHSCPTDPKIKQIPLILAGMKETEMALDALAKEISVDPDRLKRALLELLGLDARIQGLNRPANAVRAKGYDWGAAADNPAATHNHDGTYNKVGHPHLAATTVK